MGCQYLAENIPTEPDAFNQDEGKSMKIYVNDTVIDAPVNSSLFCVLEKQGLTAKSGIAVAVNQSVISKSNWATTTLEESSKILIIQATQGG